jgi:hypothetical protein
MKILAPSLPKSFLAVVGISALLAIVTATAFTQETKPSPVLTPLTMPACGPLVDGGTTKRATPDKAQGKELTQPVPSPLAWSPSEVTLANNYSFNTNTTASLTDMSSGTTQLLAPNIDDTPSALSDIGFDFFFQGVRFTQFSINDNGVLRLGATAQTSGPYKPLAQSGIPIITAYGADQRTHPIDGKVHFKVTGATPNRILIIEWLNNQSTFNSGAAADLTYQVRLYETAGVIEFVYGSMAMSTLGAADVNSRDPHIGFSSSNTAGNVGSVTAAQSGTPAPTFNGSSNDPVENLYTAGAITVLTSAAQGSRRLFSFTPPTPAAPAGLNFTGVTQLAMTLNWTDSPNESFYAVYRSTDGTNFTFDGTTAQNATSYNPTGLNPGTTYFWRVFAVSEGALSTPLSGSQTTNPSISFNSTASGGNWSAGTTWVGGLVPGPGDNATIVTGSTVTIDSGNCWNLTVQSGATLQFEAVTPRTLAVGQSVTINNGGIFRSATSGTQTTHVLSVGADLINNGMLDFSTNANAAGAGITFTGTTNGAFTLGAGSTTNLKQTTGVTVNKGTSTIPLLTFTPGGTFTVLGGNTAGFLGITNGTFKLSGTNSFSSPLFSLIAYSIPATGGFWMDNPNATVVAMNGSPTVTGLFRISQGTFNIGTVTGNSMGFAVGANIIIEGGAINVAGRFGVSAAANVISYNQSGGTITVCTVGNTSTTLASFDLGTGTGTTSITGGSIIVQLANTAVSGPRDFRNQSGVGTDSVTGATVQLGNAVSGAAKAFSIAGVLPNLVISNTSANHSATFLTPTVFNNIARNITINTGTTLNIGNNVFLMNGTTLTNNGTLTANGASSNFVWFLTTGPELYTGTGTVTAPITNMAIQADQGLTIDPSAANIVVGALRLLSGGVTNSNKITLGNGGSTTGIVQIGNTTTPTPAGTFDVPFTFNLGTGGQTLSYLRTMAARTSGPEVNPSRVVTSLTYDDNDPAHTLTIAGGSLTLSSPTTALTMTNGRIVTGGNTLAMSSGAATVTRTNGYVDGNFSKVYSAAGLKTFEVGTANGLSPVNVNLTAGAFPATFTTKAVQGPQPNIGSPTLALQRYWTLTGTGVTADLTFNYLDPTDIPVTATEANFVIIRYDGTFHTPGGFVINTAANMATITGVTTFSDWTLGEPSAPTDVALNSFSAEGLADSAKAPHGSVLLRWQTGFEVANLGFNVYRDEASLRTRINPTLIAGSAFLVGAHTALAGRSYVWRDGDGLKSDARYWLEAVDLDGHSFWYGPVTPSATRELAEDVDEANARRLRDLGSNAGGEATRTVERQATPGQIDAAAIVKQQDLARNSTIKIAVTREGWYQIKAADLIAAGLDGRVNPQLLQLFVDGREQPINVNLNKDGGLYGIEFYGMGVESPYTRERNYWLMVGSDAGKRIAQFSAFGSGTGGGSYQATVERRDRTIYFSSLRNGDRENFFGAVIAHDAIEQTLTLARVNRDASTAAHLEVALQGATNQLHSVQIEVNGRTVGTLSFAGQSTGLANYDLPHNLLREGTNSVVLIALGGASDISLVDHLRMSYQHYNTSEGDALRLAAVGKQAVTIDGFSQSKIRVLDITDANEVQELAGTVQAQNGVYSVSLLPPGAGKRVLLAIAGELPKPVRVAANASSSLRRPANGADLLVITRREFATSLEPLVAQRRRQGMAVSVVDIEDVYDEFSFGQKTPQALKDFLSYAATSWKRKPAFMLLAGNASYDPKNYLGFGETDLVPSRLIDTQYMETASDDWLADFDNDGLPELSVGRLPARTALEAWTMTTKIVAYDDQPALESLLLVSDAGDTYDFVGTSERLRGLLPPEARVRSLHRGDTDDARMRLQLIEAINSGQRVVNYVGHGSAQSWRGNVLTNSDVGYLINRDRLSLFVMMTCLNGFQDSALDSLGEALLKSERGGAVAVWASSGMTTPEVQAVMNREAYRQLFGGVRLPLGEVMRRAKAAVDNPDVRRTWILLGDPTTRLHTQN